MKPTEKTDLRPAKNSSFESEKTYERFEVSFESKQGGKLYYQVFRPKLGIGRVLVVHHGFGEHGGRYVNLVNQLVPKGFTLYLVDARGHGMSDGDRGVVNHYQDFIFDLDQVIQAARQNEDTKKVFLLGHSMGAIISFLYASNTNYQKNLDGLITSGLAIQVQMDFTMKVRKQLVKLLSKVRPSLTLNTGLDVSLLSHDQSIIQEYQQDPLFHDQISAYLGNFLLNCSDLVLSQAPSITIPIFMFHGTEDQVASYEGTKKAFGYVSSKDKTLKFFEGHFHSPLHESPILRSIVYDQLTEWLERHR